MVSKWIYFLENVSRQSTRESCEIDTLSDSFFFFFYFIILLHNSTVGVAHVK